MVERDAILETLRGRLNHVTSIGHAVLLAGEAGVGKTRSRSGGDASDGVMGRMRACDALGTPHPLAPLLDIARHQTTRFGARQSGPRPALFEAVLDGLRSSPQPEPGEGAMRNHYLDDTLVANAVLDPLQPEALMFRSKRNGQFELVGVEYMVFQDMWNALHPQPPVLLGHPSHPVRSPNRYGVPASHELHLWI